MPNLLSLLRRHHQLWASKTRQEAMAEAYRPIVRGFLVPGTAYYLFVTWGHWKDETGANLLLLGGLSLTTAILYELFRRFGLSEYRLSLVRLELIGLATNLLMYANVIAYMYLHFEEEKLVYFVLMAVVFSTSGVTLRVTSATVAVSILTLFWLAHTSAPARFNQFAFTGKNCHRRINTPQKCRLNLPQFECAAGLPGRAPGRPAARRHRYCFRCPEGGNW